MAFQKIGSTKISGLTYVVILRAWIDSPHCMFCISLDGQPVPHLIRCDMKPLETDKLVGFVRVVKGENSLMAFGSHDAIDLVALARASSLETHLT